MCFRPAEADAGVHPVACGGCGRTVFPVEGILPSKGPFCHEPLGANAQAPAPRPAAPAAPGAPAPKAPTAPGAPAPQAAPAPKAPATPGAPPTPAMAKPQ